MPQAMLNCLKNCRSYYLLEDAAADLEKRIDDLEFNPSELAMIEDRISVLTTLKKKYGPELTDILAYLANCQKELDALTGRENSSENLETSFKVAEKSLLISEDPFRCQSNDCRKACKRCQR
jgi:DNA repair protein RecN (Recombination protein N)